ncbi:SMC-Scp complex subunit ScpB [Acetobacter estunensis]|uniref:SMC-Scp complex subunit ScpB n=1 Tax=Acetobacter estunensis TaxID=104097 RepID=UPI001C2D78C5|nr:SMC-Scp complex subunit ScpB [Acetobacter estunensis]MBV1838534.1 SMC-Scp complex subunit ScpB [Acetobacter estunensis]
MDDPSCSRVRLAEALLFRSGEPVSAIALAQALGREVDVVEVMARVAERTRGLGFELVAAGDGWMFRTAADLSEALAAVSPERPQRLPRAVLETLLLIAARQPVTRPEIESYRDAPLPQKTLTTLQEQGLIRCLGRKPVPGQPQLWATTERFLVLYGVRTLSELDPLLDGLRGPL